MVFPVRHKLKPEILFKRISLFFLSLSRNKWLEPCNRTFTLPTRKENRFCCNAVVAYVPLPSNFIPYHDHTYEVHDKSVEQIHFQILTVTELVETSKPLIWTLFYCRAHKMAPLVSILREVNPVHKHLMYSCYPGSSILTSSATSILYIFCSYSTIHVLSIPWALIWSP